MLLMRNLTKPAYGGRQVLQHAMIKDPFLIILITVVRGAKPCEQFCTHPSRSDRHLQGQSASGRIQKDESLRLFVL